MNISDQLSKTASLHPTKPAYIFQDKETSYMELDMSVTKFASGLESLGLTKGDHIALVAGNSPHYIIGLYGALRLGLTVIPVNPIYTADELTYILNNADVKAVITMDLLMEKFDAMDAALTGVMHYIVGETGQQGMNVKGEVRSKMKTFTDVVAASEDSFKRPELQKEDLAVILYTSGTTGKPKGAMLTHRNIFSNAKDVADYLQMQEEDRTIAALPMFHVFCLTVSLNAPLMNGGTVIIVPKFSPQEVFRIGRELNPTIFAGVPTMYNYLIQTNNGNEGDFETIRLCISGGASMPVALLEAFEQTFNVVVSEGYGLSEAAPVTCFNPTDRPRKAGSIGQSIWNVENRVVDEFGETVPVGEVGELSVRGPNVMEGYYKLPEETAVTIKDGWLYTGDMARMDEDGYFYIVDRKKDMILVGGYNVYPREVEEVLYAHPNVTEVAVVGIPDPNTGEAVHAFVVTSEETNEDELLQYCAEHLAKYKVPVSLDYLEELPKNTTGKILRKNLRSRVNQA
ncbi:long-chain fatty acid--CoA ligase [Pontibacillus halophilus JSM 076056 = DSM 19796]|uniref:Long-chain fatty acid--CoA ligase n=1 Tax=Pontibacillus halophilus JSM 076056 = DSM 19796 TaxID=1385510 RepID=A0A0A5GN92_9BACI|nr:fatty acid--CoA ligase family protein [Pontibacillus halophilus]KGX92630.1 long-chain fatty acid--CoA ligase [Pontibacillus halophilus JSM 076056 = DSM 19796]